MIELVGFGKSYSRKENPAVNDVSFVANDGEVTGLLGVNGSGKSTILKAIAAIHFPTFGNVFITDKNGKKIDVAENQESAKFFVGYVPEISSLPPDMTVEKFLRYVAGLHGYGKNANCKCDSDFVELHGKESGARGGGKSDDAGIVRSVDDTISAVLKKCSLENVARKKIKTLSKGYKQRVSFAQGIIHDPSVLILDEPITGLDPAQIIQMRSLIKSEAETKTVLMSTHILQEAHSLCDKIIVINKGKIIAEGSEKELIEKSGERDFEAAFLKFSESRA